MIGLDLRTFIWTHFIKKSDADDKIDIPLYTKLVKLDTKLGTKVSEQLFKCLCSTTRLDIIKVRFQKLRKCKNPTYVDQKIIFE